MNHTIEIDLISEGYQLEFSNEHAVLHLNTSKKSLLCILKKDYIPIEDFRNTFKQISEIVKSRKLETFVFDKRSLTIFHQPSMEWYYTVWKVEMFHAGLSTHRKILPRENWFRKAVEIARKEIESKMKPEILSNYKIYYFENLAEALDF